MYRSTSFTSWTSTIAAVLLVGTASSAAADYRQALAATGAGMHEPATQHVTIEPEAIQKAFSLDAEQGNRALSDQEVMLELQNRMLEENQLEKAALNLDPAAISDVIVDDPSVEQTPATATTGDGTVVAAR